MIKDPEQSDLLKKELTSVTTSDWQVEFYHELSSTMDRARQIVAGNQNKAPFLVLAGEQVQGRGRQGSAWQSSRGGMYATYGVTTSVSGAKLLGLSLVVGIGIAHVLERLGVKVKLKWPNDVYSEAGLKLGGILIEILPADRGNTILIGIGINIDNTPELATATTLKSLGIDCVSPIQLSAYIAGEIELVLAQFFTDGMAGFQQDWDKRDYLAGRVVEIRDGNHTIKGQVEGITIQGALRVVTTQGEKQVWAGHVESIS